MSPLRADWRPPDCREAVVMHRQGFGRSEDVTHVRNPLDFQRLGQHLRCCPRTTGASDNLRRWEQARAMKAPSSPNGLRGVANRFTGWSIAPGESALRGRREDGCLHPRATRRWCAAPSAVAQMPLVRGLGRQGALL